MLEKTLFHGVSRHFIYKNIKLENQIGILEGQEFSE